MSLVTERKRKPKKVSAWGKKLLAIRQRYGDRTQEEAAERLGISQGHWSGILSGAREPSPTLQKLIEKYLE